MLQKDIVCPDPKASGAATDVVRCTIGEPIKGTSAGLETWTDEEVGCAANQCLRPSCAMRTSLHLEADNAGPYGVRVGVWCYHPLSALLGNHQI